MDNFEAKQPANDETIPVPKQWVYLGAFGVALTALKGAVVVGQMVGQALSPANPEGPFEVDTVTRTDITLEQEGKKYILKIDKLPEEVKANLIKQRPDLESFLTNGPIQIAK